MPSDKFYFAMTVDDVALSHWYCEANFRNLIRFFDQEGVKATFFVVPVDEETDKPFYEVFPEIPGIIKEAVKSGHAFGQHGIRHNRFELGIPPAMVLDLPHETENKRYAAENREALEADHCVENCRARLKSGRDILEKVLGMPVRGFRSPAVQSSRGMFQALAEAYDYDSSLVWQQTGWDYLNGHTEVLPRKLDAERYAQITLQCPGIEYPLACDYTWFLPPERYELTLALARHDIDSCISLGVPFVPVSHVNPVYEGEGIRMLKDIFAYARQAAEAAGKELEFINLEKLSEK
ncbi:MAG: polysaccharide deacetylase family protein [Lentisphaeria bacterium]|nr:polysaccharide deacetylase family protein [Lentisphaeria bacterium]